MDNFRMGYFKPVVSDIVSDEIQRAPVIVQQKYGEIIGTERS